MQMDNNIIKENQLPYVTIAIDIEQLSFENDESQEQCSICLDKIQCKTSLPCGHSFCKICVVRLRQCKCPLDRTQFKRRYQLTQKIEKVVKLNPRKERSYYVTVTIWFLVICAITFYADLTYQYQQIGILESTIETLNIKLNTTEIRTQFLQINAKLQITEEQLKVAQQKLIKCFTQKKNIQQFILKDKLQKKSKGELTLYWPTYLKILVGSLFFLFLIICCSRRQDSEKMQ